MTSNSLLTSVTVVEDQINYFTFQISALYLYTKPKALFKQIKEFKLFNGLNSNCKVMQSDSTVSFSSSQQSELRRLSSEA